MADFEYSISENQEDQLVHLVVQGTLDKKEGEKVILEIRARASALNYNIFCDISRATIIATLADWFFLFRNKEIYPSAPSWKTAILVDPDSWKLYKFVDNVTRNLGFNIRLFINRKEAMYWLKSSG